MGRPPQIAPEKKIRIVLSVLAGEVTIAEASPESRGVVDFPVLSVVSLT